MKVFLYLEPWLHLYFPRPQVHRGSSCSQHEAEQLLKGKGTGKKRKKKIKTGFQKYREHHMTWGSNEEMGTFHYIYESLNKDLKKAHFTSFSQPGFVITKK